MVLSLVRKGPSNDVAHGRISTTRDGQGATLSSLLLRGLLLLQLLLMLLQLLLVLLQVLLLLLRGELHPVPWQQISRHGAHATRLPESSRCQPAATGKPSP